MSSRMRRPETVTLKLSRGDWLEVKKYLTAGEQRARLKNSMNHGSSGFDPIRMGWAKCIAFLVDWSFLDADEKPIVIRDKSEFEIGNALDSIDEEAFVEVLAAIDAHEEAMAKALEAEQEHPTTAIAS